MRAYALTLALSAGMLLWVAHAIAPDIAKIQASFAAIDQALAATDRQR